MKRSGWKNMESFFEYDSDGFITDMSGYKKDCLKIKIGTVFFCL